MVKKMSSILLFSDISTSQPLNFKLIQCASPLLAISILAKSSSLFKNSICSLASNKTILNKTNIMMLCNIPLLSILISLTQMIASGKSKSYDSILYCPSIMMSITALSTYNIYYNRRSHRNGGLTTQKQIGYAVMIGISVLFFVISSAQSYDIRIVMPFLLGSMISVGLGAVFAFVADNWYAIGTGQFVMVSLDTIGILFYFVLPIIILLIRFFDKYNSFVNDITKYVAMQISVLTPLDKIVDTVITSSLIKIGQSQLNHNLLTFFIALPVVIGIPLIHNFCPINGHLFGRVYTHGNPNTKKVAICVNFSDYEVVLRKLAKRAGSDNDDVLKDDLLNVFVTLNNLREYPEIIKKLHDKGHQIGLILADEKDDNAKASSTLKEAFTFYEKNIGKKPMWYHTGIDDKGKTPHCFQTALRLEMRSAMWSTLIDVSNTKLTKNASEAVVSDLERHNGGNILYLTKVNDGNHASINMLWELSSILKDNGYGSKTLSSIMDDYNQMNL
jgi:hypothetical protein